MIILYQFPAYWNLPNFSPFCMKLETYLRMVNLPFEIVSVSDPRKSPKGKLPVIKDNGRRFEDSSLIIDYLKQQYGDTLDASVTPLQKAQALAFQRLMEEHLYWTVLYSRWIDSKNWPIIKNTLFKKLPVIIRGIVAAKIRNIIRKELYNHGMGRHSQDEIYQMGDRDLEALNIYLGNRPYFMGETPTSIDACAYAFLANILHAPISSPMTDYVKSQPTLIDYCSRMREQYYGRFSQRDQVLTP